MVIAVRTEVFWGREGKPVCAEVINKRSIPDCRLAASDRKVGSIVAWIEDVDMIKLKNQGGNPDDRSAEGAVCHSNMHSETAIGIALKQKSGKIRDKVIFRDAGGTRQILGMMWVYAVREANC
jgi:hypothetical protein